MMLNNKSHRLWINDSEDGIKVCLLKGEENTNGGNSRTNSPTKAAQNAQKIRYIVQSQNPGKEHLAHER